MTRRASAIEQASSSEPERGPDQIERLRSGYSISVILPELTHIQRQIMTAEDGDFLILN